MSSSSLDDLQTRLALAQNKIQIARRSRAFDKMAAEDEMWKYATNDIEGREQDDENAVGQSSTCFSLIENALQMPRANKTFSAQQVRDIERKNSLLVQRIFSHNRKPSVYLQQPVVTKKVANSMVNRMKMQRQIEKDNKILLNKIQSAKGFGQSKRKQ